MNEEDDRPQGIFVVDGFVNIQVKGICFGAEGFSNTIGSVYFAAYGIFLYAVVAGLCMGCNPNKHGGCAKKSKFHFNEDSNKLDMVKKKQVWQPKLN